MPQSHFSRDYNKLVDHLISAMPVDDAMHAAVGGIYDYMGQVEREIMRYAGLTNGMAMLDFGCGSGRLAHTLDEMFPDLNYTGIDVVAKLLDYARIKCPPTYRFIESHELRLPLDSSSIDMVSCFSVFTHLHHTEIFSYIFDMHRVLRAGGKLVMSFIEFSDPNHWQYFMSNAPFVANTGHLNSFIDRQSLQVWCERLGMHVDEFVNGGDAPWDGGALGQAVAIISKPSAEVG